MSPTTKRERRKRDMRKRMIEGVLSVCLAFGALSGTACAGPAYAADDDREAYEITYTGKQSEFIAPGSKLFSQVDNGLPGDVFMGDLGIANESDDACDVFLCAQDVAASGPDDMLERIPFTVTLGETPVFEGALGEAAEIEPISLGMLGPGDDMSVNCMAVIPAELTNEYAGAEVGMNVAVSLAKEEQTASNGLVQTGASAAGNDATNGGKGTGLVQTGDILMALPFILGTLVAAGTVIWCAWKRRVRMW